MSDDVSREERFIVVRYEIHPLTRERRDRTVLHDGKRYTYAVAMRMAGDYNHTIGEKDHLTPGPYAFEVERVDD